MNEIKDKLNKLIDPFAYKCFGITHEILIMNDEDFKKIQDKLVDEIMELFR